MRITQLVRKLLWSVRSCGSARGMPRILTILGVALSTGFASSECPAQSVESFYAGKQVKFVIGSAGGGGYDYYSRTVARHMAKFVPGKPLFVMQNMPGAGGMVAANYLYNVAPRDGAALGMVGRASGTQKLLNPKDKGVKFDALKFNWIGSPQTEVGLLMARQPSAIKVFEDLKTHKLVVSATGRSAPPAFFPAVLNQLFDTKIEIVRGYKGSQAALLAMEKGEVQGHCSGSSAAPLRKRIAPWIEKGEAKLILLMGSQRDKDYPGVPTVFEVAKTDGQKQVLDIVLTQQTMAWPIVAPPEVPAERVKALREAFDATMKDKLFLADAKKQDLGLDPVSGAKIQEILQRAYATPSATLKRVSSLLATKK